MGLSAMRVTNLEQELVPNPNQPGRMVTVDNTAAGVQIGAIHEDTSHVMISIDAQPVRVTFDGTAPTDTSGIYLAANTRVIWSRALALAAKFIRATGSNGTMAMQQLRLP